MLCVETMAANCENHVKDTNSLHAVAERYGIVACVVYTVVLFELCISNICIALTRSKI
jgi:hypothetical protein